MSMGDVIMENGYYRSDDPRLERGSDLWMEANQSSARLFEKSKISALRDERENVQKKTFTKWVNSHLSKMGAHINDLYHDFQDGRQLILLLEILSAEKLPKPSKGRMRIHMLENVDQALKFLSKKEVHLTNIGSHDIVDCNPKITLGLVWTIILRFQIQDLMIEIDSTEKRSAKDALLLWCQSKTQGYSNVNVTNFTTSWRDGLAFNAIIHKHRPDIIDYDKLVKEEPITNLNVAFDTAERELGVVPLLDAPDVNVNYPDEKSIMTYIATYYQYFSKMKQVEVSGSRIQKVIKQAVDNETLTKEYESISTDLVIWIKEKLKMIREQTLQNSLSDVQQQLAEFNAYRTQEKPPKFVEKGNLEALMYDITSQLRLNHQKMYLPPEGMLINEINEQWQKLEHEEVNWEAILRQELIRQQELEQLAGKYYRKAELREDWLVDNCKLLNTDNFGEDLPTVEASLKKHEAIESDIKAYVARIEGVEVLCDKLVGEKFHEAESIEDRTKKVKDSWTELLELLKQRSTRLNKHLQLHKIFQEMIYIIDWMEELKIDLASEDFGKHYVDVQDLLQKHELVEADIASQAQHVKNTNKSADVFLEKAQADNADGYKPDVETIQSNQHELETNYQELCEMAANRRKRLEESLRLHTCYRDLEEEVIWLSEKEYFASSTKYGHDLIATTRLLQQHSTLEQELAAKQPVKEEILSQSEILAEEMPYAKDTVNNHVDTFVNKWKSVHELADKRKQKLQDVLNLHQYLADCQEIETDMNELEAPVVSTDYGHDEDSVDELLRKLDLLTEKVNAMEVPIKAVEEQRVNTLCDDDKDSEDVIQAKKNLDDHLEKLKEKLAERKQKLLDSSDLYKLYSEAELVRTWVVEKTTQLTVYLKVERTDDLERCKIIQQRFDAFEQEVTTNSDKMVTVNSLAQQVVDKDPSQGEEISSKIQKLNETWDTLQDKGQERKAELITCLLIQNLISEMTETQSWIVEKSRLLASVEDPGADLSSVITLQRRLNSIERDIAALPTKLQDLHGQAVDLSRQYPEEAINIQNRFDDLQSCWDSLSKMVKEKNDSLAETGEIKRFIIQLDDFLSWLHQACEVCSSEELPQSLSEAESLLDGHFEVKTVIDQHSDDFTSLMNDGPKYIHDDQNDLQTQSLRQQMADVQNGWNNLQLLWDTRKVLLEQSMNYQLFLRDSKQCEAVLGHQELYLTKPVEAPTADAVQEEIKKLEEFVQKMKTQDEKIAHVVQFSSQLQANNHYAKEKVLEKANNIDERRRNNHDQADLLLAKLREDLTLKQFLEDSDEVIDWMEDRLKSASDPSYKDPTNVRSKLIKHKTFQAELDANKVKVDALKNTGDDIIEQNPEAKSIVDERLEKINELWNILNSVSDEKMSHLAETNRQQEFNSEIANLDKWIGEIHTSLQDQETGNDITTARALHNKHKRIEKDVTTKKQRMVELSANPDQVDEEKIVAEQQIMEERFQSLEEPLLERRVVLDESLKFYQYKRDVDDAKLWIDEKKPILNSDNLGNSLHDVQRSKKRHSNLCTEIDGREPLISALIERGDEMVNENHPRAEEVKDLKNKMTERWSELKETSDQYQGNLDESLHSKQYFFDAAEAESWLSEQELFMLGDERGKDEEQVQKMLKKHHAVEQAILDYNENIAQLSNVAKQLIGEKHPESEAIKNTQSRIESQFEVLKELAEEREAKLDENLKLFQFNREVQDLESWIADRELVASSQDIGQDFDNVQMLEERFERFAEETRNIGTERVDTVNAIADQLIGTVHADSPMIAQWKENLNESWENLLELLQTRKQMLDAAHEFHRYFHEAKETLLMIEDKENNLSEDLGRDQQSVYTLQRYHKVFEADLQPLGAQVKVIQDFSESLQGNYAGEKLDEITDKEKEVLQAWRDLLNRVNDRASKLGQSDEYQRLLIQIQNLLLWIQDMRLQIESDDKPKDISGCENIMGIHQSRKAEIDTKQEKFTSLYKLSEELINKQHYASIEIKDRTDELKMEKEMLDEEWDLHWEELQLALEVMQFAREAHLANDWIYQNEHFVDGKVNASNLNEINKMLEKQTNFERLLTKQEDRFLALERLTTFELRNARQKQIEAAKKEKEEKDKLEREFAEARERELEAQRAREQAAQEKEIIKQEEVDAAVASSPAPSSDSNMNGNHDKNGDSSSTTEEELQVGVNGVKQFGYLLRKPTKESQHKKASQRIWKEFFVVLRDYELHFYREENEAKQKIDPIQSVSLISANASVASDYHKKKNVLRLSLDCGSEYLLQPKTGSANDMSLWIQNMRACSVDPNNAEETLIKTLSFSSPPRPSSSAGGNVDQTPSSLNESGQKDRKRTKSLFGKKKKAKGHDTSQT